jgi:hypothetical protein
MLQFLHKIRCYGRDSSILVAISSHLMETSVKCQQMVCCLNAKEVLRFYINIANVKISVMSCFLVDFFYVKSQYLI